MALMQYRQVNAIAVKHRAPGENRHHRADRADFPGARRLPPVIGHRTLSDPISEFTGGVGQGRPEVRGEAASGENIDRRAVITYVQGHRHMEQRG